MTNEEAIRILPDMKGAGSEWDKAIDLAIDALKVQLSKEDATSDLQQTCNQLATDCISRQAAIRWVKTECNPYGKPTLDFESGKRVMEHLKTMPSVQPYTDEQIQRMQNMEQAQLDKAFELGKLDAQEEIIRCKECRWRKDQSGSTAWLPCRALATPDDFYCERAERGTDETD